MTPYLPLLIALSGPAAVAGQTPTGNQILERSQKAYDSVLTFEQVSHGVSGTLKATAHLWFARPGHLKATGTADFGLGKPIGIGVLTDGKTSYSMTTGTWLKMKDFDYAVATQSGISANAITRIPSMLMHTKWGSFPSDMAGKLTVTSARIKGIPVYAVHSKTPFETTQWFDKRTYFLVRTSMKILQPAPLVVDFDPPVVNKPIPASRFSK